MRWLKLLLASYAVAAIASAPAQAQALGSTLRQVQAAYGGASPARVDGRPALELQNVDYAGLNWRKIDFIFDDQNRLSRLAMTTTGAGYDAVLALASQQLNQASSSGAELASTSSSDMQIRVCEDDTGAITVTYEPFTSNG